MTVDLQNVDKDKLERIINAALAEFAVNGYARTSTNAIVASAGISKGLLFHYFGSKRDLYLYLYNFCLETTINDFYMLIDREERDFFKKLEQSQSIKMSLISKYPMIFDFVESAYAESDPSIQETVKEINAAKMTENVDPFFANIDLSVFKDGLDISKTIKVIFWSYEAFVVEKIKQAKMAGTKLDHNKVFAEAAEYTEFFKKCFYK